ncbi:leucine-rich repeat protein kinase family protein [Striga asiatica]|uniref:Leucine-rich repeat protein kinase family protein n=1 Tax=Striga asiatica TaxID=4170 RepID=A0A5A7QX00_STRAF|nr:leucine-rich repeat protein kinase family protein [Striga asiatica]
MGIEFTISTILLCCTLLLPARAEPVEDKRALLDFIHNISHTRQLNWNDNSSPCNLWTGITCNHNNTYIIAIRLPAVGFRGSIPPNTLGRLSQLQILSLRSNGLSGPFPRDLVNLPNLVALYLQDNNFQGPLPLNFSGWKNLSVLNLSENRFNGSIPLSFSNLTHLTVLSLANNSFSGEIPDLNIPSLQSLDLSNNKLTGPLPQSLFRFPSSSFSGNNISSENAFPPSGPPTLTAPISRSRFSEAAILGIVIGSCALAFVSISLLLIVTNRRKKEDDGGNKSTAEKKEKTTRRTELENRDKNTRLVFFDGRGLEFDLEDLLRASAEVLGKGTFGTTYKAALEDVATTVAVKRLKEVVVGRREFEQQMEVVGSVRHENVVPLRAYYYSKDEKLMVYDYYERGSVYALLHAKRDEKRVPFDWETRLTIAIASARGLAHIHYQSNGKLVHGNIKSSNILLDSHNRASISDLGLATLTNPISRNTGYRAPEVNDTRKPSQAADVYSFGVVLLELLTGKRGNEEGLNLVRWVQSVVREEWTGEVFDVELLGYKNMEEEMVGVLQIGLGCVGRVAAQRPRMGDVVRMLEDVRGVGTRSSGSRSTGSTPGIGGELSLSRFSVWSLRWCM